MFWLGGIAAKKGKMRRAAPLLKGRGCVRVQQERYRGGLVFMGSVIGRVFIVLIVVIKLFSLGGATPLRASRAERRRLQLR